MKHITDFIKEAKINKSNSPLFDKFTDLKRVTTTLKKTKIKLSDKAIKWINKELGTENPNVLNIGGYLDREGQVSDVVKAVDSDMGYASDEKQINRLKDGDNSLNAFNTDKFLCDIRVIVLDTGYDNGNFDERYILFK